MEKHEQIMLPITHLKIEYHLTCNKEYSQSVVGEHQRFMVHSAVEFVIDRVHFQQQQSDINAI